jgi:hypothetical protein
MLYLGLVKTAQDLISERGYITAVELSMKLTEEACKGAMTFSLQDFDDTMANCCSVPHDTNCGLVVHSPRSPKP